MSEDNLRQVWSEAELDTALATLHADPHTDENELRRARDAMLRGAGTVTAEQLSGRPPKKTGKSWVRWASAAAAVVVVAAGGITAANLMVDRPAPIESGAQQTGIAWFGSSDPVVAPGQYRYFAKHAWAMHSTGDDDKKFSYLNESVTEYWMPFDQNQEWLMRSGSTGKRIWVVGTEQEAIANGVQFSPPSSPEEKRAPRGEFYGPIEGAWQQPNPKFLAELPKPPRQLYDRLRADTEDRGKDPDLEMLVYVADALRTGRVPAEYRNTMYQALAMVPGLQVTPDVRTLDGRIGTSLAIEKAGVRQQIIVDPATGQLIGERETELEDRGASPAGSVSSEANYEYGVATEIGVKPPG
ncbi:CU044_5270 family protein [Amycolatopsis nigrescens]|uniref:CU044_5270 family protein n=1 Tax=Amycolatopsis nigrescens TaxID=381445 RepID=UPI0003811759|nr:CU044_5270 family protein [Amycolatopsis nigrescens]